MSKLHRYVAFFVIAVASALGLVKPSLAQQFRKYPKVEVSAETRIDWMYPLLRSSPAEAPAGLLDGYVSTQQRYVLFAPEPQAVRGRAMPLVLFIPMIAPVNGKISKDTTKSTAIPTRMVMSIEVRCWLAL